MTSYSTPGVYVEEISTLPPSVAQVATAVPAFIGFTEKGEANKPVRISSMLEFQTVFGSFNPAKFSVQIETDIVTKAKIIREVKRTSEDDFYLYYCMRHFFDNGGGSCYVVSLGAFSEREDKTEIFTDALERIKELDDPTLLVFPDALFLSSANYYSIVDAALKQCMDLQDRFTIIDVHPGDDNATPQQIEVEFKNGTKFRNAGLTNSNLKYGAAYTPYLNTTYSYGFNESGVSVNENIIVAKGNAVLRNADGVTIEVVLNSAKPNSGNASAEVRTTGAVGDDVLINIADNKLSIIVPKLSTAASPPGQKNTIKDIKDAWGKVNDRKNFELNFTVSDSTVVKTPISETNLDFPMSAGTLLNENQIKLDQSALYHQIKARLTRELVTLPPSAAMAGIYARVDRNRGVWKAPANESVASVIGPAVNITNEEQGRLNIDPTSGKSINCIRSFTGRGTLVWGARTLAGNDNEWRYINVRRLFITIEESVEKASAFAVFEPNDAGTWLKVKAMIDNYLYGLWQQGALAGPTPESSYFVNIGLGKTMTTEDILNGYMIVDVGVAAVRPAEFIVLRFSHKLQEA